MRGTIRRCQKECVFAGHEQRRHFHENEDAADDAANDADDTEDDDEDDEEGEAL